MNYATWKLNFSNSNYGTGPEEAIAQLGFSAEAVWVAGELENNGTVLGYVTEPQDESELSVWNFTNLSEEEALEFCLNLNSQAYLLPDGRITAPFQDLRD
jgi:hypothetical protein